MSLFYPKISKLELTSSAEIGYLSDPHNGRSHILFVYLWWYNYFMEIYETNHSSNLI